MDSPRATRRLSALIAYASSWLKCHHPDVFCAALLNAQPMGFYAPAQVVRDAREHGIVVRPVCVNASRWDCTLEPDAVRHLAVRLGLRMAKGLSNEDGARIIAHRAGTPYAGVEELWRRSYEATGTDTVRFRCQPNSRRSNDVDADRGACRPRRRCHAFRGL
jgi:error-prone DNA polymerase